ncbi:BREX-1 system adenine-specific DNA-methyltransferase PglX [Lactobacillus sp. UCMA15818]|uniref:BREX-1 system adenine-specific DNA-methyltransferase PglX n=1 Tax=Lactobacillus sp. UCMA15818 TaxID=2583394 RepID=UPI0025B0D90F|nr:BREX-1 system adenine-specific DNA-methyltransferase PglX [Lactobacillus sp. UCMA15818]MDN2452150.1 BREX-1 system adenine-specific DNA-methyltransferase PglX [Lactobacillus sp. UCMA15818]
MDKKAIKIFAMESRVKLREGIINKLAKLGITENNIGEIVKIGNDTIEVSSNNERFTGKDVVNRAKLIEALVKRKKQVDPKEKNRAAIAFDNLVEEVAYTWFNRLIAMRFMEINDYLPGHQRVLSSEVDGKREPDIITNLLDSQLYQEMDTAMQNRVIELMSVNSANAVDELYQLVFIKQCNSLNQQLPDLFERIDDYTELLFTISYIDNNGVLANLLTIPEENFNVKKGGQVEIIGWMYQYYNTEPKDKVFARGHRKIRADEIPAATQLFTPDWIVRYMVENSLGRYYIDQKMADPLEIRTEKEIADEFGWKYYLSTAEQPEDVQLQIVAEQKDKSVIALQELKLIDPAMGSGHILVYAFDVFMQLYVAEGYRERDAAELIILNNLFGLEIDKRAYQLAYFALMMKGREYNRRILNKKMKLNLYQFINSEDISVEYFKRLEKLSTLSHAKFTEKLDQLNSIIEQFTHATEIGSILNFHNINNKEIDELHKFVDVFDKFSDMDILYQLPETHKKILQIFDIVKTITSKYTAVITNPPYLNKMSPILDKYVKDNYPDVKTDLFSVFIKMNSQMLVEDGYAGFMTPFVWMFIKSYEKLRNFLITNKSISSLVQMEYSAFEEATVPVCCFTIKNTKNEPVGNYFKLSDFRGGMEIQKAKVLGGVKNPDLSYVYQTNQKNFTKIPGSPISFWVSEKLIHDFVIGTRMDKIVTSKQGLATADNNRFLREWWEVDLNRIKFDATSIEDSVKSGKKWFPYNKGGSFRRWYGNYDYVVNWENDGREIKNFVDDKGKQRSVVRNPSYYFKEAITWSDVTSGDFSMRFRESGSVFDSTGHSAFNKLAENKLYLLGLLNTPVGNYIFKILNPTIHMHIGYVSLFPTLVNLNCEDHINSIVRQNIEICKKDWLNKETGWKAFGKHQLL